MDPVTGGPWPRLPLSGGNTAFRPRLALHPPTPDVPDQSVLLVPPNTPTSGVPPATVPLIQLDGHTNLGFQSEADAGGELEVANEGSEDSAHGSRVEPVSWLVKRKCWLLYCRFFVSYDLGGPLGFKNVQRKFFFK